jgi:hypothetical protein
MFQNNLLIKICGSISILLKSKSYGEDWCVQSTVKYVVVYCQSPAKQNTCCSAEEMNIREQDNPSEKAKRI